MAYSKTSSAPRIMLSMRAALRRVASPAARTAIRVPPAVVTAQVSSLALMAGSSCHLFWDRRRRRRRPGRAWLLHHGQDLSLLNDLALAHQDPRHGAGHRRGHRDLHLHGFDDHERVVLLDLLAHAGHDLPEAADQFRRDLHVSVNGRANSGGSVTPPDAPDAPGAGQPPLTSRRPSTQPVQPLEHTTCAQAPRVSVTCTGR